MHMVECVFSVYKSADLRKGERGREGKPIGILCGVDSLRICRHFHSHTLSLQHTAYDVVNVPVSDKPLLT